MNTAVGPTPNPRGCTRSLAFDLLTLVKRQRERHWSYDDAAAARARRTAKATLTALLLASI